MTGPAASFNFWASVVRQTGPNHAIASIYYARSRTADWNTAGFLRSLRCEVKKDLIYLGNEEQGPLSERSTPIYFGLCKLCGERNYTHV